MPVLTRLACLMCAICQVQIIGQDNINAVRFAHFEVLAQQFTCSAQTTETQDGQGDLQLCREFVPKFLALVEEDPNDEAAFRCCEWIVVHCRPHENVNELYEAAATAWYRLATNQTNSARLPVLCLEAAKFPAPSREQFLQSLIKDYRQPVEVHGYAFLALGELLFKKSQFNSDSFTIEEMPAELREYFANIDSAQLRCESAELFRHVLSHYGQIPYAVSVQSEKNDDTLGQFAAKRLSDLDGPQHERRILQNVNKLPGKQFNHHLTEN